MYALALKNILKIASIGIVATMLIIPAHADEPAKPMSRGEYLARAGDCSSCHIPDPDKQPYAGGLAINSPFGTIYSTNITPDPETGIGNYTLADFGHALRDGIAKDGHHLYPAMPYPSFTVLTDNDVKDLYDYFMHEVPPAHFQPPQTRLPFPFNQRWGLAFWNEFFMHPGRYKPDPQHDAEWNRGAYLAQGIAHCGACHTPRNLAFGEKAYSQSSMDYLTGGLNDNWYAVNLTGAQASGLGRWSEQDVATFLGTGYAHDSAAFGNMIMVIENSLQFMSKDDLAAIAHYIKSLPPHDETASYANSRPDSVTEHPGAGIYASSCSQCHGAAGAGKGARYPALAGNAAVLAKDTSTLIRLMLEGGKAPQVNGAPAPATMPAFGNRLNDREIGEVLSYIRDDWGNKAAPVSTSDVTSVRKALGK